MRSKNRRTSRTHEDFDEVTDVPNFAIYKNLRTTQRVYIFARLRRRRESAINTKNVKAAQKSTIVANPRTAENGRLIRRNPRSSRIHEFGD